MFTHMRQYITALRRSSIDAMQDNLLIYGGYAAYTTILAVFPFVIFLVALAGVLGNAQLAEVIINESFDLMPAEVVNTLAPVIREIMSGNDSAILSVAALGTLWVASSGIEGLRFGLNTVYHVAETRPLWWRRMQSLGFVLLCSVGFLILATVLIVWPLIERWLGELLPFLGSRALAWLRYGLAFMLMTAGVSHIYKFLPNMRQQWRDVIAGAVMATVLWIGLASLFSYYVANFGDYATRYGSIAGVIVTLVFLHFSASIVLFGGQFNAALRELRLHAPSSAQSADKLYIGRQ